MAVLSRKMQGGVATLGPSIHRTPRIHQSGNDGRVVAVLKPVLKRLSRKMQGGIAALCPSIHPSPGLETLPHLRSCGRSEELRRVPLRSVPR